MRHKPYPKMYNKELGYQYQWLAGGYDLEIGHF